jgi:hypothetical protein
MRRPVSQRAITPLLVVAALAALSVSAAAAQTPAGTLIAAARAQLDGLNPDSAGKLLLRALDPRAGASVQERVRAFVLYGVAELSGGHQDAAQAAFREALALDPALRVDSLADLHSDLLTVFKPLRRPEAEPSRAPRGVLEIRGVPANGRLAVDDQPWPEPRREVTPGLRRVLVTAPGYAAYRDSVTVDSGATVVLDVRLRLMPVAVDTARPVAPPAATAARPPLTATPSRATSRRNGAGLQVVLEAQMWTIDNALNGVATGIAGSGSGRVLPGLGAAGTLNVSRHLAVGAELSVATGNATTLFAPGLRISLSPFAGGASGPYFLVGAGVMRFSGFYSRMTSTYGLNAGAGMKWWIAPSLGLVVEARLRLDSFSELQLTAFNGTLTAGLSLGRGRRR